MKKRNAWKYILFWISATILLFLRNTLYGTLSLDDLWNMHMIEKIANGDIPYREINMIVTPLFHWGGAAFFKIFGENIRIFYLYGAVTSGLFCTLAYAILQKTTKSKTMTYLGTGLMLLVFNIIQCPNYNITVLLFPMLLIWLEEYREKADIETKKGKMIYWLIGVLLALGILSKHTIGGVFFVLYLIYWQMVEKKKEDTKKDVRKKWEWICLGGLCIGIPFMAYLIVTNSFWPMLDLCLGGILEFSHKNGGGSILHYQTLLLFTVSFSILIWYRWSKENKALLFLMLNIMSLFYVIPIANEYHRNMTLLTSILSGIYMLHVVFCHLTTEKSKRALKVTTLVLRNRRI